MEKLLNDYLARVERYLKPLSASDRVDIVKEIKSEMLELLGGGSGPGADCGAAWGRQDPGPGLSE